MSTISPEAWAVYDEWAARHHDAIYFEPGLDEVAPHWAELFQTIADLRGLASCPPDATRLSGLWPDDDHLPVSSSYPTPLGWRPHVGGPERCASTRTASTPGVCAEGGER